MPSSISGFGSSSFGHYGMEEINYLVLKYKKKNGVGARSSNKMGPGGNITCNGFTNLFTKFRPGTGGVGASSTSNRRAKNRLATICSLPNNGCGKFYTYLGLYDNYTGNPNGYFVYPSVPGPSTRVPLGTNVYSPLGGSN